MSEGKSLINLDELTKPATVLIEKISDAVGVIYEPTRIKRKAKAEAEANKIHAIGDVEVTGIQRRAINRLLHEEEQKQNNIESISAQATKQLEEDARPENIENDWIAHFFDKCRNVSNAEMQSLWSQILAGEANNPGSFSKRTTDITSTLDKSDASLFTALCSFLISESRGFITSFIFEDSAEIYNSRGINFSVLIHLESIGLIKFNQITNFNVTNLPNSGTLSYFDQDFKYSKQSDSNILFDVGHVKLTQEGMQLAPICGATKNDEFLGYISEYYKNRSPNKCEIVAIRNTTNA